jgi:hypothetical protein
MNKGKIKYGAGENHWGVLFGRRFIHIRTVLRVTLPEDLGNFRRLPVDKHARIKLTQLEVFICSHTLLNPTPAPVNDVPSQGEVAELGRWRSRPGACSELES